MQNQFHCNCNLLAAIRLQLQASFLGIMRVSNRFKLIFTRDYKNQGSYFIPTRYCHCLRDLLTRKNLVLANLCYIAWGVVNPAQSALVAVQPMRKGSVVHKSGPLNDLSLRPFRRAPLKVPTATYAFLSSAQYCNISCLILNKILQPQFDQILLGFGSWPFISNYYTVVCFISCWICEVEI